MSKLGRYVHELNPAPAIIALPAAKSMTAAFFGGNKLKIR